MPGAGSLSSRDQEAVVDYVLGLEVASLLSRAGFGQGSGQPAPPFSYRNSDGSIGAIEQLKGKVVLVAFWCVGCYRGDELENLQRLADQFRGAGLIVLPLCVDETDPVKVAEFAASHADHLPVYAAMDPSVRHEYNVVKTPQAALVDKEGRWFARSYGLGPLDRRETEEFLCACLGVPFPLQSKSSF
jgi:peroxiredoxin